MCFNISYAKSREYWEERFGAEWESGAGAKYEPTYFNVAATSPECPVITNNEPDLIRMLEWGLIPGWVRSQEKAEQIRGGTVNARDDTLFEKPSFRGPIIRKRCLVLADGFFEWRSVGGKKYPYYIRLKSGEGFAIAGIWDRWELEGLSKRTFSVITTRANPLLEMIHNTKKRMPVILPEDKEKRWLADGLGKEEIKAMLEPLDEGLLEAYPISKMASSPAANRNVPGILEPHDYEELRFEQKTLF